MNKARRILLDKIDDSLIDIKRRLSAVLDDEQTAMDNMPENLWSSDRYMEMEDVVEQLTIAIDYIEDAQHKIRGLISDEL